MNGNIDIANPQRLAGWARDPESPEPLVLIVFNNGTEIGRVTADDHRQDLEDAKIGNGHYAFTFEFASETITDEEHVIRIVHACSGEDLPGSPVTVRKLFKYEAHRLSGSIDSVTSDRIRGWARDQLHPDDPVSLIIILNDKFLGRVLANGYREDLRDAGIGNGRHAFSFEYPAAIDLTVINTIRVLRETDGAELTGSPVVLQPSPSFDAEVEAMVARAIERSGSERDIVRKLEFLVTQIDKLLQANADAASQRLSRARYAVLLQRWKAAPRNGASALEGPPPPVKRALVIDDRLPQAGRDAGSNAILSHMQALQRLGYHVTIAPAADFGLPSGDHQTIEALGISCCCAPYYGSVEEVLRRQAGQFDLIYLHRVSNAAQYGELALRYCPKAYRVYSVADLHHVRVSRQAASEDRPELVPWANRLKISEFTAAAFADSVITHSDAETQLLQRHVPRANVFTVPWSVEPRPTRVPFAERRGLAFIGSYDHAPNQDAARWLISEIMPLVKSRDPSIESYLVGSRMPEALRQLASDRGVVPLGHVEDLSQVFDRVRLTVAPLAFGAGVKGKVLDSLAAGVPCVCTTVAAEGLVLPEVLRALVADSNETLAENIFHLHNDEAGNQACGLAGLQFIEAEFSEAKLDALMKNVISGEK